MGQAAVKICGGEGPLKSLMTEYKDDIGKFIAIEKVKILLDDKISDFKKTIDTESVKIKNRTFGEI